MELEFFRQDLIQTGTCLPGTLAVLPLSEERKTQKVAAGDGAGVIQCFSVKKGEFTFAFKTLPGPKVSSLTLGRARTQRDRIFVACGSQVKGISRKGKEFFKFNTQQTEQIRKVDVHDKNIWCAGEFVHNHFIEGKDKGLYLCPDRMNDAEIAPLLSPQVWWPVLACQDRYIRAINSNTVQYEAATRAAPTVLKYVPESHDPQARFPNAKEILYGTDDGTLSQLLLEAEVARQGFSLANPRKLGGVKAVYSGIDFTKTGANNIVLGREDGVVEVYDVEETGTLRQVWQVKLTESINAIDGGYVTSLAGQELVLHTFSGKVISYAPPGAGLMLSPTAPEGQQQSPGARPGKANGQHPPTVAAAVSEDEERRATYQRQIQRMRGEIEGIRAEIEAERQRFLMRGGNTALLAMSAPYTVQDRLKLEAEEACYVLLIESAVPIFTVAIQCSIRLQLLDVPSNVAIISRSPPDEANGNLTLATYRCQDSTSRLAVKFKVREGQAATLTAFILPQISPKTCVSIRHIIRPLCLHQRITEVDTSRPTNDLTLTGSFGLGDIHTWVCNLLPDLPPALPPGQDSAVYHFQNTLLGTQLTCRYRGGEARFTSDLISTLGIIQQHVMREATAAKQRVDIAFSPSAQSLAHSVARVWPQLEKQRALKKVHHLLEGLQELKMQDGDVSYLSDHYRSVLERADKIRAEYRDQPQHLDHLCALIKDLYLDFAKLTGVSAPKQRLPALDHLLSQTSSTLDQVMDFMLNK